MTTEWLDHDEQRAWRAFLRMHTQLTCALAQGLKADSDMSIQDYEVLAILSEADGGALRAFDLRHELRWEKSRLAHHVRRMEARGLVRREACADDARAPLVCITDDGLAAIRAAAPQHVARVRELFLDALTRDQVEDLRHTAEAVLARVGDLDGLTPGPGPARAGADRSR